MTLKNKQKNFHHAFTLVELLVVIVIVATLSTVGFLAIRKAMNSAHKAKTTVNMRQIATANQIFSTDNNGILMDVQWTSVNGAKRHWSQHMLVTLHPELAEGNKAGSPEADQIARTMGIFTDSKALKKAQGKLPSNGWRSWCTFTYNRQIGLVSPDASSANPKNMPGAKYVHQVEFPSQLMIAAQTDYLAEPERFLLSMAPDVLPKLDFDIYSGLTPVVFFDGHVEWFRKENFPVPGGIRSSTKVKYTTNELNEYWNGTHINHRKK